MRTIFRASSALNTESAALRGPRFKASSTPDFRFASRSRRRGAALIEFALIASLFFTMLLGMIQFGIYQSTANTLWNLSREGARYASVGTPSDADIKQRITQISPPNITSNNLTVTVLPAARLSGQPVTIRLVYDMRDKLIFPSVSGILNKTYSTVSTMRVE